MSPRPPTPSRAHPRSRRPSAAPVAVLVALAIGLHAADPRPSARAEDAPATTAAAPSAPAAIEAMAVGSWTGRVSAAMEAMRRVHGAMTPEETRRFEASWAPMFRFPAPEAVAWLERAVPILAAFLDRRAAMVCLAVDLDRVWVEVTTAATMGDEAAVREALSVGWALKGILDELSATLDDLARRAEALGDPPDADALRRRARKRHDELVRAARDAVPAEGAGPVATGPAYVLVGVEHETFPPPSKTTHRTVTWAGNGASVEEFDTDLVKAGRTEVLRYKARWSAPPPRIAATVHEFPRGAPSRVVARGERVPFDLWIEDAGSEFSFDASKGASAAGVAANVRASWGIARFESVEIRRSTDGSDKRSDHRTETLFADVSSPLPEGKKRLVLEIVLGPGGAMRYRYEFDPTGSTLTPADAGASTERARTPEELEREARASTVAEHKAFVAALQANLEKDRAELARATPDRRAELLARVLHGEAEIQAEEDLVRSYETGTYVHTRTRLDEAYHAQLVSHVVGELREIDRLERLRTAPYRLAGLARTPGQTEALRAFVRRQSVRGADEATLRKIADAVTETVRGELEGEQARAEERRWREEEFTAKAESLKKQCERNLFVLTFAGGHPVMVTYQATVGFLEGEAPKPPPGGGEPPPTDPTLGSRVRESLRRGAAWYSTATYVASEAFEGYEKGGYLSGDETKGTAWGAVERAGEAFVMAKALEYGFGKVFQKMATTTVGKGTPRLTLAERVDVLRGKQRVEEAKVLAREYERTYREYQRVLEFGGRAAEIAPLEAELRRQAAQLHRSMDCKLALKAMGRAPSTVDVVRDYNQRMTETYRVVEAKWRDGMKARGFDDVDTWIVQEFRNAASADSAGMDHDAGLLDRGVRFYRNGVRTSLPTVNEEAQAAWEAAYQSVTKQNPRRSWEEFTTTAHREAYRDLAWLGEEGTRRVRIDQLDAAWAGQAADVTAVKGYEMLDGRKGEPIVGLVETCRGTSKDLETKVIPLLERAVKQAATPKETRRLGEVLDHWRAVSETMANAPKSPLNAVRLLRVRTGKDVREVVGDARDLMAAFGKALGKPTPGTAPTK